MAENKKYIYKSKKGETIEYTIDWGISLDYEEALDELHKDVDWFHERLGDYQGELVHVGKDKEGNYVYKNNSYGSCSGCDWVQGIDTEEEAIEYLKSMEHYDVVTKDKEKFIEYLEKEVRNCWDFEEENLDNIKEFLKDK